MKKLVILLFFAMCFSACQEDTILEEIKDPEQTTEDGLANAETSSEIEQN